MEHLHFRCGCGQQLVAARDLTGRPGACPTCGALLAAPGPAPALDAPWQPDEREFRPCPSCGGSIRGKARKCLHCGELLDPSMLTTAGRGVGREPRAAAQLQDLPEDAAATNLATQALYINMLPGLGWIVALPLALRARHLAARNNADMKKANMALGFTFTHLMTVLMILSNCK